MVKKAKKASAKKIFKTNIVSKNKSKKVKSKQLGTKKPLKKAQKLKTKKTQKLSKKEQEQEEQEEQELIAEIYEDDDFNALKEYYLYQNDLENLPHDKFDIYEVPKTIKENEEYLKKLIEESDIILYLLDARDIFYTLDKKIEKQINKENKLLFYVINKIDLVSQVYLKKMSNQLSKETNKKYIILYNSCLIREKIQELYDNLKNEISKLKKSPKKKNELINIGIIGMPNVGKNSLVQSFELLTNSICDDKFILFEDNKLFCINSVPATIYGTIENNYLISKLYKNVKDIPDPSSLLNNLFNYIDANKIKNIYELTKKVENLKDLISCLKKKFGIKTDKIVLQQILRDIISGKITYEIN